MRCVHPIQAQDVVHTLPGIPQHQVRAHFTDSSVFVYQAFRQEIATKAVTLQRFTSPFSSSRMTWIKPSFAWMMHRSGWATNVGQEHVLRIEISRFGFEWALTNSCLSSFNNKTFSDKQAWRAALNESPVRIQWDPERTLLLEKLPWRTIQIGIGPAAVNRYVNEWVLGIEDITAQVKNIHGAVLSQNLDYAASLVHIESSYELSEEIMRRINAD